MAEKTTYSFAILNVVPHVHTCYRVPVGVILHARTSNYLDLKVVHELDSLNRIIPDIDHGLISEYLQNCVRIAHGDPEGGVISLSPNSERFHWLTAPRSDVIQASVIHEGMTALPLANEMERLFKLYVR